MSYITLEEKIVGRKNAHKSDVHGNILDCIYIKQIPYIFEYEKIYGGRAKILLPLVFNEMSEREKRSKYISIDRPDIIKTSGDGIDCCFKLTDQLLKDEDIEEVADMIKDNLLSAHTTEKIVEQGVCSNPINKFSWFTYKISTLTGYVYVHMYITTVEGKMLLGFFNCPSDISRLWKDVMKDMMFSLVDLTR